MTSKFSQEAVEQLLVDCHRRCCICHRFCGSKIETDHIQPQDDGGASDIENAIAVCFECHAEIHSYNDRHPRGRKFHPSELLKHKQQWITICKTRPDIFMEATRMADVGPLQALIDELEFNQFVATRISDVELGCLLLEAQFHHALAVGAISTLNTELKQAILAAYHAIGLVNQVLPVFNQGPPGSNIVLRDMARGPLLGAMQEAKTKITAAHKELLRFLGSEE